MQNNSGTSTLSLRALRLCGLRFSESQTQLPTAEFAKITDENGSRGNDMHNNSGTPTLSLRAPRTLRFKISRIHEQSF
jgi:hypothetical protein